MVKPEVVAEAAVEAVVDLVVVVEDLPVEAVEVLEDVVEAVAEVDLVVVEADLAAVEAVVGSSLAAVVDSGDEDEAKCILYWKIYCKNFKKVYLSQGV